MGSKHGYFLALQVVLLSTFISWVSGQEIANRVVGGEDADEGVAPYQVSIRETSDGLHFCGGAIIDTYWVLTAAHCLVGYVPQNLTVVVGTNHRSIGGDKYQAIMLLPHPGYDPARTNTTQNDIGLLRTQKPIQFNDLVNSIKLADQPTKVGAGVIITGWGRLSFNGARPDKLQTLLTRVISVDECRRQLINVSRVFSSHVCTVLEVGQGACMGDSGGPVMGAGQLIGIISWGLECARGAPDVHTSVYFYREWIKQNMLIGDIFYGRVNENPASVAANQGNFHSDTNNKTINGLNQNSQNINGLSQNSQNINGLSQNSQNINGQVNPAPQSVNNGNRKVSLSENLPSGNTQGTNNKYSNNPNLNKPDSGFMTGRVPIIKYTQSNNPSNVSPSNKNQNSNTQNPTFSSANIPNTNNNQFNNNPNPSSQNNNYPTNNDQNTYKGNTNYPIDNLNNGNNPYPIYSNTDNNRNPNIGNTNNPNNGYPQNSVPNQNIPTNNRPYNNAPNNFNPDDSYNNNKYPNSGFNGGNTPNNNYPNSNLPNSNSNNPSNSFDYVGNNNYPSNSYPAGNNQKPNTGFNNNQNGRFPTEVNQNTNYPNNNYPNANYPNPNTNYPNTNYPNNNNEFSNNNNANNNNGNAPFTANTNAQSIPFHYRDDSDNDTPDDNNSSNHPIRDFLNSFKGHSHPNRNKHREQRLHHNND